MRRAFRSVLALVVFGLAASSTLPSAGLPTQRTAKRVADGVALVRLRYQRGPVRAFVLRVVVGDRWSIDTALAGRALPSYASTPEIAKRQHALAAVNGDFGPGYPIRPFAMRGILITSGAEGNVVGFSAEDRRAYIGPPGLRIAATSDAGSSTRVRSWNLGTASSNAVVGFTPAGGVLEAPPPNACAARLHPQGTAASTGGATSVPYVVVERRCAPLPMAVGRGVVLSSKRIGAGARWIRSLTPETQVTISWSTRWPSVGSLQGGHPRLVHRGEVVVPTRCDSLFCRRQPRTGIGIGAGCVDSDATSRCVVMLVVVDGRRSDWSAGLSLVAFARLLRRVGAVEALNMDGGGSTQMIVRGHVVNRPSERPLREIPAAWIVRRA